MWSFVVDVLGGLGGQKNSQHANGQTNEPIQ